MENNLQPPRTGEPRTLTPRKPMPKPGAEAQPLPDQRVNLRASTTGHTVQVPVALYFATYQADILPSSDETDALITWVQDRLVSKKVLIEKGKSKGWPSTAVKKKVNENDTYRGLEPIAEQIHDLCLAWNKDNDESSQLPERTTRLVCRPNHETASEVRGGSMRTDARFILMKSRYGNSDVDDKQVKTCDVTGAMEAKLDVDERGYNEDQIVGAVGHILYNDPGRRFVLSFTVEGSMMRFWSFSRSHIAVSAEFDYHKNPRDFIRFIIFMMFAPVEKLGYDPTVVRVRVKDKIQYQFTVDDKKYQTIDCIDERSAWDIVTRATRVWSVRALDANDQPTGKTMVLKDVWLYSDAESELAIQEAIIKALEDLDRSGTIPEDQRPPTEPPNTPMAVDARRYFMTILHDVAVQINAQDDATVPCPRAVLEYRYTPIPPKPPAKEATVEGSRGLTGDEFIEKVTGGRTKAAREPPPAHHEPKKPAYPHTQRIHRRIVFKEECVTLYATYDYGHFALALAQLVHGLDYMRLAGFIHRDISPGNCLFYVYDMHVKISDLEYTRPYDSQCLHDAPLTGTPGFMAIEYQRSTHFFNGDDDDESDDPDDALIAGLEEVAQRPAKNGWFRFNFLHDVESALWIYAWFVLNTLPDCLRAGADTNKLREAILVFRNQLFDGSLKGSTERNDFVRYFWRAKGLTKAQNLLNPLLEKVQDPRAKALSNGFATFNGLVKFYKKVQLTEPVSDGGGLLRWDPKHFKHSYYSHVYKCFMAVHEKMKGVTCKAISHHNFEKNAREQAAKEQAAKEKEAEEQKTKEQKQTELTEQPAEVDGEADTEAKAPKQATKRPAGTDVMETSTKKLKTSRNPEGLRHGKRRADESVDRENTKKAKRAASPSPSTSSVAPSSPTRQPSRTQAAPRGAKSKVSAGKKKQAAKRPAARQPSGAGSSAVGAGSAAAGTSGQPPAGPPRRARTARTVEPATRTLRSRTK